MNRRLMVRLGLVVTVAMFFFLQERSELIEFLGPRILMRLSQSLASRMGSPQAAAFYDAAILLASDEPGVRQDVEMFHDRRSDIENGLASSLTERFCFCSAAQQCTPRRVGQRRKGAIKVWFLIVNRFWLSIGTCLLLSSRSPFIFR